MNSKQSLLEKATRMAVQAHATQKRKGEDLPYITHPIMVALLLSEHDFSEEVIAAGMVHDVIEDTAITEAELRDTLGDAVADIVTAVTNDDSLDWKEKKQAYIDSVREASIEAKAVAVADKVHNAESLINRHAAIGPVLWNDFNAGRESKLWFEEAMLAMLQETWEHPLVERYAALVSEMKALD